MSGASCAASSPPTGIPCGVSSHACAPNASLAPSFTPIVIRLRRLCRADTTIAAVACARHFAPGTSTAARRTARPSLASSSGVPSLGRGASRRTSFTAKRSRRLKLIVASDSRTSASTQNASASASHSWRGHRRLRKSRIALAGHFADESSLGEVVQEREHVALALLGRHVELADDGPHAVSHAEDDGLLTERGGHLL